MTSFYFERSEKTFDYLPGQYVRVSLPQVVDDVRGNSRMFSIASSPTEKEHFMITTKLSPSPFKKYLQSLKTGEAVDFFGPLGKFVFAENEKTRHIMIAGGIGITSFYSMIVYSDAKKLKVPITLFASFSILSDCIYQNELNKISEKNKYIDIVYTLTQKNHASSGWQGEIGRINDVMLRKYVSDVYGSRYYLCGSEKVVHELVNLLGGMSIANENIRSEEFSGY